MPPRTVKRGSASSGSKRPTRASKGSAKAQNQLKPDLPKESLIAEDVPVPVIELESTEEVSVEEKKAVEEIPEVFEEKKRDSTGVDVLTDVKSNSTLLVHLTKEDEVKDDGFEKDERLDLDDNEPEYETEEYGGVDYDEKESEMDDVHEVGEELEDPEEDVGEEEEADMLEEDVEDVHEEVEGEEDEDNVGEDQERVQMDHAEEDEHHEVVKERRKRKEYEVFVGGLDKDATEEDLRKVFSVIGEITEVRLMMNPQTKKNKGFAFLRFPTVELAKRAVIELKNPVINGKQCGVTPSQDSDTLFLGNICKTWTKEALKEKLKHYGVDNVDDLTLVEDSNNLGMNRGFAFLEFQSRSDAMDAFKRLQKRDVVFGVDRPAKVSFADSFIDPGDEIMAQVKTVFIDGLPAAWDEDHVSKLLKKYGGIEKVELARNMPSAKRKDFGFVTFESHDAAVTCAKSINNAELGEGDNKAKVRARLSRPLQRSRGKHGGRGDVWSGRGVGRSSRGPWGRPTSRSVPMHGVRGISNRPPPANLKRSMGVRDKRPIMSMPTRGRPFAPAIRPHDRRPPVPSYPKSAKREYGRHEEILPPKNRVAVNYGSRVIQERRPSFRDEYASRGPSYSDLPRTTSRPPPRRPYADDGYGQKFERNPFTSYREGRARDYDSLSGSKRPYGSLDDVPSRYADGGLRQSRARLDYEYGGSASQYEDAYGDRLGRSNLSYGGSRGSMSGQSSHGLYGSRHGMGYGAGSFGSSDTDGIYSSSYGGDYMSRGSDVGSNAYSSMYPSRNVGGSSYMGGSGSGSYY